MTHPYYIKFGPVCAKIQFDPALSKINNNIKSWLGSGLVSTVNKADIEFTIASNLHKLDETSEKLSAGNGWMKNDHFGCWDERGWENSISRQSRNDQNTLLWECSPKDGFILSIAKHLPSICIKLAHQHYFSHPEMSASTFLYRQLIPAIQIILLEHNATLIHSSALRHSSGIGILVSGWGGSGKTSASSYLYLNQPDEWQYMSDDLAILDSNGTIHYSPIPLNVFPYNTQQFPTLEEAIIGKMGILEKAHWKVREHLLGNDSVARRTAPFNESNRPENAPLSLAIHLQRSNGTTPVITECTASELAIIAKNILNYELRHGWPTYQLANAFSTKKSAIIPSADEIAIATEQILIQAMSGTRLACINVPKNYSPAEVSATVEKLAKELIT